MGRGGPSRNFPGGFFCYAEVTPGFGGLEETQEVASCCAHAYIVAPNNTVVMVRDGHLTAAD